MNRESTESLFRDFPKLFPKGRSDRGSLLFFGFDCGDGWYKLIRELAEKITPLLKTCPESEDELMCAVQVKEKYGTLRVYMNSATEAILDILQEYEKKSAEICEFCGKPGITRAGGWIRTVCNDHYEYGI